jgi:hypothetical protein
MPHDNSTELDLDFFWAYLDVARSIPAGKDSCGCHLRDVLHTYNMGGEL